MMMMMRFGQWCSKVGYPRTEERRRECLSCVYLGWTSKSALSEIEGPEGRNKWLQL